MTTLEYCVDTDIVDAAIQAIEDRLAHFGLSMNEPTWCEIHNDISHLVEQIHVLEDK